MASIKPTPDLRPARINALGEFAASIAHEVKQPLAAVTLNAQACLHWLEQDPPRVDQARTALRVVLEASTAASAMLRSLHGMACQAAPQRQPLVVNDVVRDVLQLLRGELRQQCITVTESYAPDYQLRADRVQLMQVLMNLILNAIEAARDLHDRARTLALHTSLADDGLRISVADNGVGIAPALAERIFDPLFSTKPGGTGMGLAICRTIVQSHGGRIWSEPGQPHGTVFHLSFKEYTLWTPSRS
ncbi:HAMP domain-containing histidine kinase [Duganella dendranthematis]|jgi:signal transduction histidine kinase|uniref:histidine kinase n=1 Tax=Duganella dendranthematis TaxID=2728021 RepID=A0ABX6MH57_9BURK|nr:HAMP domain-containing sensor histidine kinase [Duganella dendranthematis]QJD93673.1 HAMP domain-containing histidine kinase [Duganella dendranthematis]